MDIMEGLPDEITISHEGFLLVIASEVALALGLRPGQRVDMDKFQAATSLNAMLRLAQIEDKSSLTSPSNCL